MTKRELIMFKVTMWGVLIVGVSSLALLFVGIHIILSYGGSIVLIFAALALYIYCKGIELYDYCKKVKK